MLKNLKGLKKIRLEVGHFESQGEHSTIGMSYVDLMEYHHIGDNHVPPRPVLSVLRDMLPYPQKSYVFKSAAKTLVNKGATPAVVREFFNTIGVFLVDEERQVFGNYLQDNSPKTIALKGGRNTPLIETGELKAKVSYKHKLSNGVVTPEGSIWD